MSKKVVKSEKKPKSYRFSEETLSLLSQIAEQESRTETNMLEVLVKEKAAALGITAPKS